MYSNSTRRLPWAGKGKMLSRNWFGVTCSIRAGSMRWRTMSSYTRRASSFSMISPWMRLSPIHSTRSVMMAPSGRVNS